MKKKNIVRQSEERLKRIEGLEAMLGRRKQEIMMLKEEVQGLRELNAILEAMIFQITEAKGCVEVSRKKLSEGIGRSFSIEVKDDVFVLKSEGDSSLRLE